MPDQVQDPSLYASLLSFFKQREFRFEAQPEKGLLRAGFKGANGNFRCVGLADETRRILAFYTNLDANVPPPKRPAVGEFITRANYCLLFGNFELDFADGQVRYKTVLALRDGRPTMDMIDALVLMNVRTFDRYYPGLMAVIWSDEKPEDAIRRVEGSGGGKP